MKVLIDNGHGAETPGKRSPGKPLLREFAYTHEIAIRVASKLQQTGILKCSGFREVLFRKSSLAN